MWTAINRSWVWSYTVVQIQDKGFWHTWQIALWHLHLYKKSVRKTLSSSQRRPKKRECSLAFAFVLIFLWVLIKISAECKDSFKMLHCPWPMLKTCGLSIISLLAIFSRGHWECLCLNWKVGGMGGGCKYLSSALSEWSNIAWYIVQLIIHTISCSVRTSMICTARF